LAERTNPFAAQARKPVFGHHQGKPGGTVENSSPTHPDLDHRLKVVFATAF
jgi:hypothetical protein